MGSETWEEDGGFYVRWWARRMVTLNEIANNAAWFSLDKECKVPLLGDDLSHGLRDFLRQ